jgi:ATP-binding cassette subfamily B protein
VLESLLNNAQSFSIGLIAKPEFIIILKNLLLILATLYVIESIFHTIELNISHRLGQRLNIKYRKLMVNHLLNFDFEVFTNKKSGSLVSIIERGTEAFWSVLNAIRYRLISFFTIVVVSAILVFKLSPILTVFLITFGLLSTIINFYFAKRASDEYKTTYLKRDKISGTLVDYISNILQIKVFGQEKKVIKDYSQKIKFFETLGKRLGKKYGDWGLYGSLFDGISLVLIMGIASILFASGDIMLGGLALTYTLFNQVKWSSDNFVAGLENLVYASNQIDESIKLLELKPKILDKEDAKECNVTKGAIDFKGVTFKYERKNIFNRFNLKIKSKEKIAIVGPSGGGKTTITKLLYRLYNLDEGSIYIDGQNIRDLKQSSLRSSMTLVPQECILFDDTIYNNVKFGMEKATKGQVFNALKKAKLYDFVMNSTKQEKTLVGERGIKLSGGEKQRMSLARAFLSNKKIIVFDEPTSALDSETEAKIQKSIAELTKNRTSIIIAHRFSTIMSADRIIVLDEGKIVEEGTHKQLLRKKGKYAELWKYQSEGFIK